MVHPTPTPGRQPVTPCRSTLTVHYFAQAVGVSAPGRADAPKNAPGGICWACKRAQGVSASFARSEPELPGMFRN